MSVDFNYLQKKLQLLNEQTAPRQTANSNKDLFWKPTGSHVIRMVQYIYDPADPLRELFFYYNMFEGQRVVTSPASYGLPDPVIAFAKELQSRRSKEDYTMGKKLEPKRRYYAVVLPRGEEHLGPKYWGFSETVAKEILGIMLDPDYGDITDPMSGRDLTVTWIEEGQYPKTTIRPKPNTSPLTTDPLVIELLKKLPRIEDVFKAPEYDELEAMLKAYLNPDTQPQQEVTPPPVSHPGTQSSPSFNAPATNKPASAIAAFDQLFKNA